VPLTIVVSLSVLLAVRVGRGRADRDRVQIIPVDGAGTTTEVGAAPTAREEQVQVAKR
jgi:hypothetical protein